METTETTSPSADGSGFSDRFISLGDIEASGPEATITERWYRLHTHAKSMCELMVAFNSSLEPGYAPQGLGSAVHAQLARLENLVAAARISITPAVAATDDWKRDGSKCPSDSFAGKTGSSRGKARSEMETGKNLASAPGTQESFLNGDLSPEQAATIADAVKANPAAEQELLDCAKRKSLKELKTEALRRKSEVEDMDERERRLHRQRYVRQWTDSEGGWNLRARGPIPTGADFQSVLERLIDQQFKAARKSGQRGTRDNYAYDALMNLAAQHGMGNGPAAPDEADPIPGPESRRGTASSPESSRSAPKPQRPNQTGHDHSGRADDHDHDHDHDDGHEDGTSNGSGGERPKPSPTGSPAGGRGSSPERPKPSPPSGPESGGAARTERQKPGPDPDGESAGKQDPAAPTEHLDPAAARSRRRSRPPVGQQQIYCIDWNALVRGNARTGERCELRGVGPTSVSTIRRMLASAAAKLVVTDPAGQAVTVAHLGTGPINLRLIPGLSANPVTTMFANLQLEPTTSSKLVIIGISVEDLRRSEEADSSEGHRASIAIPGLGDVPGAAALRVLGSEVLARLVTRGQAVRQLSYAGRAPNAAQRIALAWADLTCKVEGCPNERIEIDHRNPWAADRVTELDNLDPLCGHHHDLKTNAGWRFVAPDSTQFVPPDDPNQPSQRTGPVRVPARARTGASRGRSAPPASRAENRQTQRGRSAS